MFCDLVGSTALAVRLDPEDLREIIAEYRDRVAAIVRKYGGTISRYIGDGMLILFGHPSAHEDDTERAVRAAWIASGICHFMQYQFATSLQLGANEQG
jgi:class 3 adenylate cyclase